MGGYTERLAFDADGDLVRSSVQFGEGTNAAIFNAVMTNIRHEPIAAQTFRFRPGPGQLESANTDTMLPVGTQAPSFTLPTANGKSVRLADQRRGKRAVLVNFWYYNCAPCRLEFPEFEKLYQQYEAQGLNVIAINKADSPKVVSDYVRKAGLSFTVLMGGSVSETSVFSRYKVAEVFPGTYLLDEHGRIVYRSAREDMAGLERALAQLGFKSAAK
jgi:peroxiredoxin